ncbi:MAG: universal stress protein [Microthrixaceae bacterium]
MSDDDPGLLLRVLLVGVDGSDGSRRALEMDAQLAVAVGAHVVAVHVLTYNHEFVRDLTPDTMHTWRRDLQHDLETGWVEPLLARGVEHRCLLLEGDSPAAGLLEAVESEDADVLIVGANGHGNLAERMLGGVSYRVTHRSPQPVIVVPADWSDH